MYIYEIIKVSDSNKEIFVDMYKNYFLKEEAAIRCFIEENICMYFVVAKYQNEIIGCMGIREKEKDFYAFLPLVVHINHRRKKVATNIVRNAVIFLTDMGATRIRNHKRENIIPHSLFTDMGFELIEYKEKLPDYKWMYELDVSKVDIE